MKANELRIGNIINYHDEAIKVKGIVGNTIYYGVKGEYWDSNIGDYVAFTPIPLTEKWLVKFGFDLKMTYYNLSRENELGHQFGDFAVSLYDETQIKFWRGDRYCGIVRCQYVHQLQNLYFALTGEELTITEK